MDWMHLAIDLVFIAVLVLGLYRTRHGRKDLVIALIGANVGVMVVAAVLQDISAAASLGVGLGLFGVLSIIRLRSTELEQYDVAYYFSALAMGLVAGLDVGIWWQSALLMALPIAALAVVDSTHFMSTTRRQRITVDRVIPNEADLSHYLCELLGAKSVRAAVVSTDLVQDKMVVDAVYRLGPGVVETSMTEVKGQTQ